MKKFLSLILVLVLFAAFPADSLAALPETWLYSPALDAMTFMGSEESDVSYCESFMSEDGLIFVDVLTVAGDEYGMIGEGSFAELMELRVEGDMRSVQEIECEGIGSYPAQRIRFETGENEDMTVVDATAVWVEGGAFVYIVLANADAWYGYRDGYEDGVAPAMVDEWVSELQIGGYETDEWDFVETDATLVLDRSCGVSDGEEVGLVERREITVEGECDAYAFATILSELTGLDFIVECWEAENGALFVDWQLGSTLLAGLGDREQVEEFFFFDNETLNWFMLDSLYATICENLGYAEVYYTMDGGSELVVPDFSGVFPLDVPYMGSAFYFGHSDVMGDVSEEEYVEGEFESNDYGFYENYVETEFFSVGIPAQWEGLYDYMIVENEPFGYTISFSEKESGFVFGLEARWFDDEIVQLESVWQGYLGRMNVDKLGDLDLLFTVSQPAPDAGENWQMMLDSCREVVDTILLQEGVALEMGEYIEYQP